MHFPRYWARHKAGGVRVDGRPAAFHCWGWSDRSREDAAHMAQERAFAAAARLVTSHSAYPNLPYDRSPLRETVIERVVHDGREIAVITRNCYGALVLNAASAMFVDIDVHEQPAVGLRALLGKRTAPQATVILAQIKAWSDANPALSMRVYRTAAGFRVLMLNRTFSPADDAAQMILKSMNSDPLYIKLCVAQQCFRARLTPKPFRIGMGNTNVVRPMPEPGTEVSADRLRWLDEYARRSQNYAVCGLAAEHGISLPLAEINPILELHDRYTRVRESLPLA